MLNSRVHEYMLLSSMLKKNSLMSSECRNQSLICDGYNERCFFGGFVSYYMQIFLDPGSAFLLFNRNKNRCVVSADFLWKPRIQYPLIRFRSEGSTRIMDMTFMHFFLIACALLLGAWAQLLHMQSDRNQMKLQSGKRKITNHTLHAIFVKSLPWKAALEVVLFNGLPHLAQLAQERDPANTLWLRIILITSTIYRSALQSSEFSWIKYG
jgi:hypothetical protein